MKKILTIFFIIALYAAVNLGQTVITQTHQELRDFYDEFNNAVRRFCFYASS